VPGNIGVQPLQFLTKLCDILIGCALGRGKLSLQCRALLGLALSNGMPPVEGNAANDQYHHNQ
jgi:hypothetical protein